MDLSKLKTPDWLIIAGGLVVFVLGFFNWFDTGEHDVRTHAFRFTLTGLLPWLLITGAAVLVVLLARGVLKGAAVPWPFVLLLMTGLGTLLIVVRLLVGADASEVGTLVDIPDFGLGRAAPLYLSTLGGAIATGGAFLNLQADAAARAARRHRRR